MQSDAHPFKCILGFPGMPFARKFENGMGFPKVGQVIKGFTVESVSVSHVNIRGGHYEYPAEIIVKGEGGANRVKRAFKEFYEVRRTIFSGYGNPYQCGHGKIDVQSLGGGKFLMASRGACVRIHLVPELKRFMAYLFQNGILVNGSSDEYEWMKIITAYMMDYKKSMLRTKPFFQ